MMQKTNRQLKILLIGVFCLFAAWWIVMNFVVRDPNHDSADNQIFAALYGLIAVIGGSTGLLASRRWGGSKSLVGRALLFFSCGLLLQEFGQIVYSFYLYILKGAIPYPSLGDVGYFGSVLVYILAAVELMRAAGIEFSLRNRLKQMAAIALPVALLIASYVIFLRNYQFDFSSLKACITVVLDFGYPLGQATYIAIALVTCLFSQKLLGGLMKRRILLLLLALFIQYVADFSFLYANQAQTVYPGGINDFLYLLAYTVMGLGLNSFRFSVGVEPLPPQPPENAG